MFHNRKEELDRLNQRYKTDNAEFIVVYGRRRVGKTALVKKFADDKNHIYFVADMSSETEQLRQFTDKIYYLTQDKSLQDNPFRNWQAAFAYVENISTSKRLILILDEYQYLAFSNPALPSILQKAWDEGLGKTKLFLILCGSYISFMEDKVLGYKSPLYGRRTGQFFLAPLSFFDARPFFETAPMVDQCYGYGMLGGLPAALRQFNGKNGIEENIRDNFLYPDAYLYQEVQFLLMEELREPSGYYSILKSIAFGNTRPNEIAQACGLPRGTVVKYLSVLQNLRIVTREVPITEKHPDKSRKGIYRLSDYYFKFWFRFVMPYKSFIEEGEWKVVLKRKIRPYLDQYTGEVFEQIAAEYLKRINREGKLPLRFERVGRYWDPKRELDIVAIDEEDQRIMVGECKWSKKPVGQNIFYDLVKKASLPGYEKFGYYYALFSRSGFTESLQKQKGPNVLLFSLDEMEMI